MFDCILKTLRPTIERTKNSYDMLRLNDQRASKKIIETHSYKQSAFDNITKTLRPIMVIMKNSCAMLRLIDQRALKEIRETV